MAIGFYAAYMTTSDGFVSPVLSMLSLAAPPNAKGQVMGYFVTVISITGLFMPVIVSNMLMKDRLNMSWVGLTLSLNTCIPNLLSAICFIIGGWDFSKEMESQKVAKVAALATAIKEVPGLEQSHESMGLESSILEEVKQTIIKQSLEMKLRPNSMV